MKEQRHTMRNRIGQSDAHTDIRFLPFPSYAS